jgi:hypothetical protein
LAGSGLTRQADRSWQQYDGRQWAAFAPAEKQAYLAGFLAGAGLAQAEAVAGVQADSGRVAAVLDSLERAGALRFAHAGSVYAARLSDFFWWENHASVRLYLALRHINQGMRQAEQ